MMQLRQLEIFVNVVRTNSFSKAADLLFLTQPTVSSHIHALEEDLNTKLLVRSTKGLCLTPEGALFFNYASQIVNLCDRAVADLKDVAEDQQNRLSIAASSVPSQYLLPRVLPEVKHRFPKIRFDLVQGDSASTVNAVSIGQTEIGIVGRLEKRANLKYIPLLQEQLAIVTPNVPYFREMNGHIAPEVLRNSPFIMREPDSGTRKYTEEYLQSLGIDIQDLHVIAQMESTESVLRSIQNGLGISVVSEIAANLFDKSDDMLVFRLDDPLMTRRFYVVYQEDVPLSPAAKFLLEQFRKVWAAQSVDN